MKFKNYHLRERYPEGFISTQPHKPRLEATETDSKSGIWIGSAGDNKFFKKEDYRFLYELFRELVEKGIEPLTDDLMHKDELAKLRAERDALIERCNEQYLEQAAEIAALREKNEEQAAEIAALRGQLEVERMRLACCGVIASSNTRASAEAARSVKPEYWSGSAGDVADAVDREMALRDDLTALRERIREAATVLREHGFNVDAWSARHPVVVRALEEGKDTYDARAHEEMYP